MEAWQRTGGTGFACLATCTYARSFGFRHSVRLQASALVLTNVSAPQLSLPLRAQALEVVVPATRSQLMRELDGHVVKCVRDQNGNHVIQKVSSPRPLPCARGLAAWAPF